MMHLPIPAGYSEPVSHPAEHSNIRKLGLLEGCCSCCYSFSLICYTWSFSFTKAGIMKVIIHFVNNYLKDRNLHAVSHFHIAAAHWMLLMILQFFGTSATKRTNGTTQPLMIFVKKCNKSPYSARKHCKGVILKIMSFCNYILKLRPPF